MTRIILRDEDGKQTEAVSKQDFDSKANVTTNLYVDTFSYSNFADLLGQKNKESNALQSIRFDCNGPFNNNYGAGVIFGGGDTKGMLTTAYDNHNARITSGNDSNHWSEDIAWKSDIQKLQDQIDALEKQIGGGH